MPERRSMTSVASESRQWLANAVLSAAVLEPLHELNRRWLTLLMHTPRLWPVRSGGARLPDPDAVGEFLGHWIEVTTHEGRSARS